MYLKETMLAGYEYSKTVYVLISMSPMSIALHSHSDLLREEGGREGGRERGREGGEGEGWFSIHTIVS